MVWDGYRSLCLCLLHPSLPLASDRHLTLPASPTGSLTASPGAFDVQLSPPPADVLRVGFLKAPFWGLPLAEIRAVRGLAGPGGSRTPAPGVGSPPPFPAGN